MTFETILAFNLALLAALIVPGPAMLFALRTALVQGRMAGILTGAGLGLMAAIWTALALLGLNSLFALVPWAYVVLKTAGALYLLWVAYATWRDARRPLPDSQRSAKRAFLDGMLINLANPKSVLFAAAVLVVIFPQSLTVTEKALIILNHFLVELIAYGGFAIALSTGPVSAGYLRLKPVFDKIAATILGGLGLRLLLEPNR